MFLSYSNEYRIGSYSGTVRYLKQTAKNIARTSIALSFCLPEGAQALLTSVSFLYTSISSLSAVLLPLLRALHPKSLPPRRGARVARLRPHSHALSYVARNPARAP